MNLYEILVPTIYGDTRKPISTRHHKEWDKQVIALTKGLTIFRPAQGKWIHAGHDFYERTIPVRIMCDPITMRQIAMLTLKHYRQIGVMFYLVSSDCRIFYG